MPATRKTRYIVRVESGRHTSEPSHYGLFNDLDRACAFANRITKRINEVRNEIDQAQDYWHAMVEPVLPPLMHEVERNGWF
jgi:predicted transcriptional regulator